MRHLLTAAVVAASLISGAALATGIRIDTPRDGEVIHDVAGNLFIEAELGETDLAPRMFFVPLLNGKPATSPSRLPVFRLKGIDAGHYRLTVQIVDPDGKVLATSDPIRFEMRRKAGPS